MSEYSNIPSKVDFVISFFPKEFIDRVLKEKDDNRNILTTFIEGIHKTCELLFDLLKTFWNEPYKSVKYIKLIKTVDTIPKDLHDHIIDLMLSELDMLDLSLIGSLRNEIEIVNERKKIKEILLKIKDGDEKLEKVIDVISEFFIGSQYYKDFLMTRSNINEFKKVQNKCFEILSEIVDNNSIVININILLDSFIEAMKDNFIIDPEYKKPTSYCKDFIKDDMITRDIKKFKCLRLLFASRYHSDCLNPFCWFDYNFSNEDEEDNDNEDNKYDGTIKSLEKIIVSGINDFNSD